MRFRELQTAIRRRVVGKRDSHKMQFDDKVGPIVQVAMDAGERDYYRWVLQRFDYYGIQ